MASIRSPTGRVGCGGGLSLYHVIQWSRISLSLNPNNSWEKGVFRPMKDNLTSTSRASLLGCSLAALWCLYIFVLLQVPNMVFDQRLLGNFFQDLNRNDNSEAASSKITDAMR